MNCPKCESLNVYVENSYSAGTAGVVQRRICRKCGAVIITAILVTAVNPPRGKGAFALANKLRKEKPGPRDRVEGRD